MSCGTNGPIRKAYCHDDVRKNPKRLVPSLMGFCARAGLCACGFASARRKGFFLRTGKKKDFWGVF